jgi:hypothetical protein
MKLLRDESGYVLVLRRPRFIVAGETAAAEQKQDKAAPVASPAARPVAAACSMPHYCFYCTWCGVPIMLPTDRIGSPFGNPDSRKIEAQTVATVCLHCHHIANYSMFRGCRGYDTRHRITHTQLSGETVLLNWLRCTEPLCQSRLPIFATIDPERRADENDAVLWIWDGLTCSLGHEVRPTPLDPTLQLPLRSGGTR